MLSDSECKLIQTFHKEGKTIQQIAKILNVTRKTVSHWIKQEFPVTVNKSRGKERVFLTKNEAMIQELYLTHEGNSSALCRTISTVYAVKISLRMLQRFCKPFRQVLREVQVTEKRSVSEVLLYVKRHSKICSANLQSFLLT